MKREVKAILVFATIFIFFIIALLLLMPIFHFYIIKKVFDYVVQNFVNITGMSSFLVKGLVIFLLIPFVWAILEVTKLNFRLFKKDDVFFGYVRSVYNEFPMGMEKVFKISVGDINVSVKTMNTLKRVMELKGLNSTDEAARFVIDAARIGEYLYDN